MCLYNDEISPGNQLRAVNSRKVQAYYLTFVEFGPQARCQENLWFCIALARTCIVDKIVGGLSALTHQIITHSSVTDLASGCMLTMGESGERFMFFASLKTMLGDESALKFVFDIKGASGTLPCALCSNIVSRQADLQSHDRTGRLRGIEETDSSQFALRTDRDVWNVQDLLASREAMLSKEHFNRLQQSTGMNRNPHGVIAQRSLALVATMMYDWMHVYLVNGLFHYEVGQLLPLMYEAGHSADSLLDWMQRFIWPHNLKGRQKETLQCFQKRIARGEFRASASQSLNAYPLLRLYALGIDPRTAGDELRKALRSFLDLCRVLDLLLENNRGVPVDPSTLEAAITKHCRAFIQAHGIDLVIPKFHYAMHLPLMARSKQLVCCFTHERKHRHIKQIADNIKNPGTWFEDCVFKDAWGRTVLAMQEDSVLMEPHLISPKAAPLELLQHLAAEFGYNRAEHAQAASVAQLESGQTCAAGDVVILRSGHVGEAWLHCRLSDGALFTLMVLHEPMGRNSFRTTADTAQFVPLQNIKRTCLYIRDSADRLTVVP